MVMNRDFDPLQQFSWSTFAAAGVFYSALQFSGVIYKEGALIFTTQNAKPLSAILTVHFQFLTLLLGLMWIAPFVYPHLSGWLTDTVGRHGSGFDILFVFLMAVMHLIERRWIYLESESDISNV
jgi:hypothetical protein